MKAQQLIQEEIEKLGKNPNQNNLRNFLRRVLEGIKDDVAISGRQKEYILNEISWYSTVGEPRVQNIGTGVPGEVATKEAHQRWLRCPTTVNTFVSTINGMGAK